jgi:hypothetical protein
MGDDIRIHRTVKIDLETDRQLKHLTEVVPVLTVHAAHLACLRAGLESIQSDPNKLMSYLAHHKVRIPTGGGT